LAITYFAVASQPADNGAQAGPTATVTVPGSMVANDYVVCCASYKASTTTIDITTTGGQTWTSGTVIGDATSGMRSRVFHCRFNGTWATNPVFTQSSGGTAGLSVMMLVFRGVDLTTAIDVAESGAVYAAPSTPFDVSRAGVTLSAGAVAIAFWVSADDNTWAVQTAGWANPTGVAQVRNTSGTDTSMSAAYIISPGGGATGAVVNRQTALGGDAGTTHILALKAAAGAAATSFPFRRPPWRVWNRKRAA
jgi:hypothetical protein